MEEQRSLLSRWGIVLLNVPAPGLGLLRVQSWRRALPWLAAPVTIWLLASVVLAALPTPHFWTLAFAVAFLAMAMLSLLIASAVLTWRASCLRSADRPWWSRWYSLIPVGLAASFASEWGVRAVHGVYKPFYAPSQSMAPTISLKDRFVGDMRGGRNPERGDVILFEAEGAVRIYRVVGLPGDRVAMRRGLPVVNGRAAEQRRAGSVEIAGIRAGEAVPIWEERLPGEKGTHRILDQGHDPSLDDMEERRVPADRLFVLGDNRDQAADSRVPSDYSGVGMVPTSALIGRPLYFHWSKDRSRIGTSVDP